MQTAGRGGALPGTAPPAAPPHVSPHAPPQAPPHAPPHSATPHVAASRAPAVGGLGTPNAGVAGPGARPSGGGETSGEALAFKVMRLNRPSFYTAVPSAGLSLLASDESGSETSWCARDNGGDTLCFPAGFGNIYLGETLEAFVSACNNGSQQLTRLEVRAEIQTGTKRVPLLDGKTPNSVIPSFAPRQYTDYLVSHELKEAGVHIMICSGSYMDASGEEKKVRQYFKFQVCVPAAGGEEGFRQRELMS